MMQRRFASLLAIIPAAALAACTGLTQGENAPGEDTWLETGSIAVDPRTETSYVLRTTGTEPEGGGTEPADPTKTLWAVSPEATARVVDDVSDMQDLRILFPQGSVLLMGEVGGSDRLRFLDPSSFEEQMRIDTDARYNGTRMSASRRFVAVADNSREHSPIHVIDTDSGAIEVIPHDGEWLEAMWLHETDTLVAIVFYDPRGESARARILTWSVEAVASAGWATGDSGLWADPQLDIEIPDVSPDLLFSYTWVGISPNDDQAVFPVRGRIEGSTEWTYDLLVLDMASGEVRTVEGARGPVGFTPDGSTIVSYDYVRTDAEGTRSRLLLVDAETLESVPMEIPFDGGPSYFVSHEGNYVVVADALGDENLVLYDLDAEETTALGGDAVDLNELVSRTGHGEMWLVDRGLYRLHFMSATFEEVDPGFLPGHINILRERDRLVLDDVDTGDIVFFDPAAREVTARTALE